MIRDSELTLVGRFNKPHGVNGEISASLLYDTLELGALRCLVVKVDGINVPFFLRSLRPKGRETVLLSLDGYDTEKAIGAFANADFYALSRELPGALADEEAEVATGEGMYAADLIGYTMTDAEGEGIGAIEDIEDSTANVLFVVRRPEGEEVLVPVADEFIVEVDTEKRIIVMDLPEGLV